MTTPRFAYGEAISSGPRCPSTWSTPFWVSSSTTITSELFQSFECAIELTIRPTARSLSATSATGYGSPVPTPAVWSSGIQIISRLGTVPAFSCLANSCCQTSVRYWSGMARLNGGKGW